MEDKEKREDLIKRLRRIEGQVRGIQKMLEEEKDCAEVLTQVAAVRSAMNKVGNLLLEGYAKDCMIGNETPEEKNKKIYDLMQTVQKFLNFID
jgi:CsoR family transcriptional regulator, copper-sensing transcriptional repressor